MHNTMQNYQGIRDFFPFTYCFFLSGVAEIAVTQIQQFFNASSTLLGANDIPAGLVKNGVDFCARPPWWAEVKGQGSSYHIAQAKLQQECHNANSLFGGS